MATKIQASLPPTVPLLPPPAADPDHPNVLPLPEPPAGISLTSLFGAAPSQHHQTLHELYAAQIATIIWNVESEGPLNVARRDVLVGISLKKTVMADVDGSATYLNEVERKVFREVMGMLYEVLRS
jgi:proteasome assembly chaperone 3